MTWIKICGTTNLEDALLAVDAGADALGFVLYEKSPRHLDAEAARRIVAELPPRVEKIGVFAGHPVERIEEAARTAGFTGVQLHGGGSAGTMERVFRLKAGAPELKVIVSYSADQAVQGGSLLISAEAQRMIHALMFDSGAGATPGGTGKTFDWNSAQALILGANLMLPVIVAGGLNPWNVREAMDLFQPWGVDVVSGVEKTPGKKDPQKVRDFITAVRAADRTA